MPVANSIYATIWMLGVETFRNAEEENMIEGIYEEGRDQHRFILSKLIADGERVLLGVLQNGLVEVPSGIKVDDLKATLESLHATFYCEHGPKNSAETNRLIEGLFDVATA